ncbi:MAG: hypothetical protein AAB490_01150, partial [Patescibacteria group bacterium]
GYRSFHYLNFDTALKIAVIGDTIVNSYISANNQTYADVFTRDGMLVEEGIRSNDPRALAKRIGNGVFMRHFNAERLVEVWRTP